MKKTLLICLCFCSVFTCLAYVFPINTRFEEDTDIAYFANDCLLCKQQNVGAINVGKFDKSNDLLVPPPNVVVAQYDDKPSLAGRIHPSSVKYELTGAITVSISPTQNKAFHIKGDELELIAIVTGEVTGDETYEWYYIKNNGEEELIEDSFLSTTVDGSCLIIHSGLKLTTVKNTVAPIFSIVDHIPSLGEIVFNAIPTVGAGIYAGVSQEMLRNEFGELNKITSYTPKGYTMPIGVRVIMGGISATSSLFTRPVFTRPATPTYTVDSPTSCCQEDVITLTNTSSDVNDPSVIYMWLWYPSNNTPTPFSYPFASADLVRFVNQNELSIPMKKPGCAGNYTLMAFSVPTSCFSVAEPTDVMVYPKPTSRGNTQLKTIGSGTISNTYCEGATIQIEGDKDGLNSDQGLEIGYQWYHDGVLIKNSPDGAYDKEYYSIGNATPDRSGTYTRVATASYANGPKKSHCSVTATIRITVNPKLAKPGAITYNLQTCDGDDLVLSTDPVVGASQYRWNFADLDLFGRPGTTKTQETKVSVLVRRNVDTNMAVTYTVTALDDNGCESLPSDETKVELLDKKDEACVKVYINPLQNMAFVCKDSKFALMASTSTVSMTTQEQTDMEAAEKGKTSAEYRWYYVNDDGSLEEIKNNGTNIIVAGRVLIMNNGPEVTTTLPAEASAFSIADNIPGLTDILRGAKTNVDGANNLIDLDDMLGKIEKIPGAGAIINSLKEQIKNAATQKLKEYLPKDLDKYAPKEYTMPITAQLIEQEGGPIKNATPFTRPVFERPKDPAYTISPLTCCQGDVVTFSSDDAQLGQPEVMYMWLGLPGSSIVPTSDGFGLGSAFLTNPTKMFTKGPISITMGSPTLYTGNYALSAFRGAPSPVGCSSIGNPTKIIVYGVPISERNTRLKTRDGELTYCEGETINIKSKDGTDLITDGAPGKGDMLYKWYDKNNTLIKSDGNYEFEKAGIFGPPRKGENLIIKNATAADAGTYTRYAIFEKTGCKTAATIAINISPKPAPPTGLTSNSPICPGDNLVISVPPGAVGVTAYEWTDPNSKVIKSATTSILTIENAKEASTYSVKAKNAQKCVSDAATITVALAEDNLATLLKIYSNAPVVEGARLALSATDIPGATYEWKGPNGFSSTSPNCLVSNTATAAMSGTYTLTVTKCNGTYIASKTMQVQLYDKSVLDILNTDLTRTICSGDPINIALSSTLSGVKYRWTALVSNGNASSPTTQDNVFEIKATPINSGLTSGAVTYTVTPIFKDGTKEITGNPKDFVITVLPIKSAPMNDKVYIYKNSSGISFAITSSTRSVSVTYNWYSDPDKTTFIESHIDDDPFHFNIPKPSTYTYYVTAQTAGDPCESAPAKLEFKVEHTITLSFNKNPIDQGESAVLTASLSGVTAPAGGITITLQHTPSSFAILPTIYIPAGSSSGFTTIVTTKSLIMLDDEKISFTGTKAAPYTIILPTDLTIQRDQSLSTITLNFNQASVKGGEHATLTAKLPDGVLATQPIEILLEADDDHSTAEEDENYKDLRRSMTIDVGTNSKMIEAFTAKNKGVIDGLTHLVLEATAPRGYRIADPKPKISISDTTGDDPANRVMTLAFQKPSVIGGDIDKLIVSLPKGIVSANDISVTLTKDPNTGKGTSRAKRNINYESFPEAIDIPAYKNSVTYPLTTIGDEKVSKITTMAISGTAQGYKFKSLAKVSIISGLHVPNVFTPGGVGDHPTWMITGLHLYPNCDVKVFNRYGQIVFKSRGYAEPWNGGYQNNLGKEMPVGTYYYVIQLNSSHKGAKRVLKGHVAIIR